MTASSLPLLPVPVLPTGPATHPSPREDDAAPPFPAAAKPATHGPRAHPASASLREREAASTTTTLRPRSSLDPVRLRLTPAGSGPHRIDGAWWPRSDDLTAELPGLIGALPHSWPQIAHATVNAAMWSAFPGRLLVANQVIQLHRSTSRHAPNTLCLLAPGRGRWDLLVVPPETDRAEALRLLATTAGPIGPARPGLFPPTSARSATRRRTNPGRPA
ncbi:DUF5994 family protein [Streptomyces sp. MBT27]|uniref:DUF5994 family protein n=1 Tax=Streptomyces sp. MBT27 TaxID=1488356 RepID=UPI001877547E|nr:DUF5994 family protein [Streptomyces sp. MBT27]